MLPAMQPNLHRFPTDGCMNLLIIQLMQHTSGQLLLLLLSTSSHPALMWCKIWRDGHEAIQLIAGHCSVGTIQWTSSG
jgi:hypothetical protein